MTNADTIPPSVQKALDALNSDAVKNDTFKSIMQIFKAPPKLSMSQWAEKNWRHNDGRLHLLKFQAEILDGIGEHDYTVVKKSARIGYSMMLTIISAYGVAEGLRCGLLLASADDVNGFSNDEIGPSFERNPEISKLMKKGLRNTASHKIFSNGGVWKGLHANAARSLRRHNLDWALVDEASSLPASTDGEGDPVSLFRRRIQNSSRSKFIIGSTPTTDEVCVISAEYEKSDKRKFFLTCPHCGCADLLLTWDKMHVNETPVTEIKKMSDLDALGDFKAQIKCDHCEEFIDETHKPAMVAGGEFRSTEKYRGIAGYEISTLYSTFAKAAWPHLIREFVLAQKDPNLMKVFVNTVLGETWSDKITDIDEAMLKARPRGDYSLNQPLPADILFLCAGIDIQANRAELQIHGITESHTERGKQGKTVILSHETIWGDPTGDLFSKIDSYLDREYDSVLGGSMKIFTTAIDSGAWSQLIYDHFGNRISEGIFAIKGASGRRPIWSESKLKPGNGNKLFNIGVDTAKNQLFHQLSVIDPESDAYIEFGVDINPESGNGDFFEQLTGETRVLTYKNGRASHKWVPKQGVRHEVLDCAVYALAAASASHFNFDRQRKNLTADKEDEPSMGMGDLGALAASLNQR